MSDHETKLPRSAGERVMLGIVSFLFSLPLGFATLVVLLTPMPDLGALGTLILIVVEELLLASTVVTVFAFIWAVATPGWVERLLLTAWKKIFWAILIACVPLAIFFILGVFGIKAGDVLGPQ